MKKRDYFFIFIMATYLAMNILLIIAFAGIWQNGYITLVEHRISILIVESIWLAVSLLAGFLMTWRRIIRIAEEK
jgi:hypothetical protein